MARGHPTSPPDAVSLPKVSFTIVSDEISKLPAGVKNKAAIPFGYNDFSDFSRPSSYVRHIEPLESDLAKTVEYDMDEQDEEWLNAVNEDRKKNQLDRIDQELFEIMMDRLEKEWFDLTKNLQKPDLAMPSEDSTCAICDDSEGENSNAIVFCDGCNLAVHQDCYGVPYIPEGQWLCRKCTVSPENPVECILCPNEGGAFKQTLHGEWVHLLCAIWIPETRVANEVFMEPITGVNKISKQRWKLKCSICDIRAGACIQCAKSSCFLAFHATCARKEKLLLPMKSAHGAEPVTLTCYCERHLPEEQQVLRTAALEAEEAHEYTTPNSQLAAKSARAYAKTYKPGPPLVPAIVVDRIMLYTDKLKYRKKIDFARMLCRYWSLKREARRGAPLLKRLHLEPWTASAGAKVQTEEDKLMRLDQLIRLRQDLVNVKALTQLSLEREGTKFRQVEIVHDILVAALLPLYTSLRSAFERITSFDKKDHFKNPVSKNDVPDYFDIVKNPMCWTMIDAKINKFEYWDFQAFRNDVELVINNALMYNQAGTQFHKDAIRIQKESGPILNALQKSVTVHDHPSDFNVEGEVKGETDGLDNLPPIGDLEPPLDVLELLTSSECFKENLNMEVANNPIISLFNYEFATWKPPPLEPEDIVRSRKEKTKPKRDRKAEVERAKANKVTAAAGVGVDVWEAEEEEIERRKEQERELQAALDSSSGFRIPRTRSALAAAAAFEAEARGSSVPGDDIEVSTDSSKANRPRKRSSVAPVGLTSVPRVVNDVDNRDSFHMFNAGWILPPDQKRGGRASAMDRSALPPPRKRPRTDQNSRLSMVSTAASDNQTLLPSDPIEAKHNPHEPTDIPMDVDGLEDEVYQGQSSPKVQHRKVESVPRDLSMDDVHEQVIERPHNVVTQPNGVVVIEKLDTPAIRREKNQRRKAEKQKMVIQAGEAISAGSSSNLSVVQVSHPPISSPTSQEVPSQVHRNFGSRLGDDIESELSELSDLASEVPDKAEKTIVVEEKLKDEDEMNEPHPEIEKEGEEPEDASVPEQFSTKTIKVKPQDPYSEKFPGGTLVWAKADSYPWWPAVVHTPTSANIPRNIYRAYLNKTAKRNIQLFIVQFYDKQESWQSVPINKLELLGEDQKLDNENLNSAAKQKWKPSASKQQCLEAYERAMSEIIQGDEGETSGEIVNLDETLF